MGENPRILRIQDRTTQNIEHLQNIANSPGDYMGENPRILRIQDRTTQNIEHLQNIANSPGDYMGENPRILKNNTTKTKFDILEN